MWLVLALAWGPAPAWARVGLAAGSGLPTGSRSQLQDGMIAGRSTGPVPGRADAFACGRRLAGGLPCLGALSTGLGPGLSVRRVASPGSPVALAAPRRTGPAVQPARGRDGPGPTSSAAAIAAPRKKGRFGPRVYLSAAFTVTAGVLAAWSRHEADQAYDRYLHAASQQRQKDSFRRAERHDRMAGVALAGMEAGIVLTTWLVFF